ncbi:MAG: type IV-A pilus assembly ATPase PilB [Candidatus Omnitrophica bacterium]|nr:type IV-A pilus assembly ATPase PilB [Candidatus Omnitrophota bacterium]
MKKKLLGEMLVNLGIIADEQLQQALDKQAETQDRLGDILVKLGHIDHQTLQKVLASQFGMETVVLDGVSISDDVVRLIPADLAWRHKMIPLKQENDVLSIAISDPLDLLAVDNLRLILKCDVQPNLADPDDIEQYLKRYYPRNEGSVETIMEDLTESDIDFIKEEDLDKTEEDEEDAPIIKLVTLLILEAFRKSASDIHIEPMEKKLRVRYRIDGVLHEVPAPPKRLQGSVISRIKIMSGMDIAEKRVPQDGRIKITLMNNDLDLRVSALPANYGESVVLRILDKSSLMLGLAELGFMEEEQVAFEKLLEMPNGIILVTGPTGSGKTTTLYGALNYLNRPNRKLITVEDPVEYQLSGINQVQVNAQIGLDFARGLRAMLRQAPDVILVGEIRDFETASIAIQAALTGHLVFSTLHTNDAPGAVTRLTDMGVKPFLIASGVQAIMAQRLVRRMCANCKEPYQPTKRELMSVNLREEDVEDITFYKGVGCATCSETGYKGRQGIFEMLVMNDQLRELIFKGVPSGELREAARKFGMRTLREDGTKKVLAGITTIDEVMRITQTDSG